MNIKIYLILAIAALLMNFKCLGQAPQSFKYQAVARDITGTVLANRNVSFQISILEGAVNGPTMYCETHLVTTNQFGLVNLNIGNGTIVSGVFSLINWGSDTYFIKVEMDTVVGTNYQLMGISQLLSVPYALNSASLTLTSSNGSLWSLAVDSVGKVSALPVHITCPGFPIVSYLGQNYPTIKIGNQCWLKKNINVGTMINGTLDQTNNGIIEKYCFNDDTSSCAKYGGLYQWAEALQYKDNCSDTSSIQPAYYVQGICPSGWHVPNDADWNTLINYLGGDQVAGGKMKEPGSNHWSPPNTAASNTSGFTAFAGGYRTNSGTFTGLKNYAMIWSSTLQTNTYSWSRYIDYSFPNIYQYSNLKTYGFSVRCVKD